MDLNSLGKALLALAAVLALVGLFMVVGSRLGLGTLPGDLRLEGRGGSCYIPIVSSIVISLILTLLLNLLLRWWR